MTLSWEDRLKLLFLPGPFYYRRKLEAESRRGEPEISLLPELLRGRSGTAIDVGANRGIYSYLLSGLFDRVVAFEPNPDLADFARRKLPANVELLQCALGAKPAPGQLQIPRGKSGREDHLTATLRTAAGSVARAVDVDIRTLDSFEIDHVNFIKIDVEGTELAVISGASRTIARDRPLLLVELLTDSYDDPAAVAKHICAEHGYRCQLLGGEGLIDAISHLEAGLPTTSRNVLFSPDN